MSPDGEQWVSAREGYLLPVKVLGKLFRGKFLAGLRQAYDAGDLQLTGSVASLTQPQVFRRLLGVLYRQDWVVYAKQPFGGAEQVYRYLGRYTHRVAISNARLLSHENGRVCFRYKNYADAGRNKTMALSTEEFIRRFLLHVLPARFVRIRHYGLLASRNVSTRLADSRRLLVGDDRSDPEPEEKTWVERIKEWFDLDVVHCPRCGESLVRHPLPHVSPDKLAVGSFAKFTSAVPILDSS